ncbi:MAG: hypothetical protein M0R47_15840 [Methylobacter sp.]|uniref:hypothetical protein n=1 Tax=Methylobacter sp. TaxID=2051955 RepID=UPI0025E94BCD|nr:hypothetical protein [Methylobacter sp.]MCK9621992.1 hypothetical protein [Methylobacter sp.]
MDININVFFNDKTLNKIFTKLTKLETTMSEFLDRVKAELTEIKDAQTAARASFDLLIVEVRKLIAQGDLTGADQLLVAAQELKDDILASVAANTELTSEVDAVNG